MNILVFGASGFLGRSLMKFLIGDKNITMITAAIHKNTLPKELHSEKVREAAVNELLGNIKPEENYDVVVSLTGKKDTPKNGAAAMEEANIETPKRIVDFCKNNNVKHLILASSINTRILKSKGYAEHKRRLEVYLQNSGAPYTIFRPALIFGPGDSGLSRVWQFIKKIPLAPVFGDGKKLEQPIYVEEAACFFYKAVFSAAKNRVYEIGGLKAYTYNDLMYAIADGVGRKIALVHIPAGLSVKILTFFEKLGLMLPVSSEQIMHIDMNLDIDNSFALKEFSVELKPFEERIKQCL
jgi:NADH dehydrogenase